MAQPDIYLTPQEYLEIERVSETRHEYHAGKVSAMAGASRRHNRIVSNIVAGVDRLQKGKDCNVYASDMRVRTTGANSFTYPDVVITCGPEEFLDGESDTLLNPLVIVEVLSGSTAEHDRTTKVGMYRRIQSLREYLLVAQDTFRVEQYVRQTDDLWMYRVYESPQAIVRIESAGLELSVAEVYAKVSFGEEGDSEVVR